ncbi:beta strand repeat-containing protein [Sphingomonas sp. PAMC 26605]|uniref:beta strand repeat-containing protein n=1 Tax=Sphingomonas sp. PAMC 26605 TaxID=1112214 RepID=UPI00026CDD60|nr:YadA-like family protein [Sphingomonas sp. PAMC 26605]
MLATMIGPRAHAQEAVVGVCSGVSLPRSVVTGIAGNVLAPVIAPLERTLGTLTLGTVDLGLSTALTNAAAGAPIALGVLDINGNAVDLATTPRCVSQADGYTLRTPAGLAIGGNRISGLGSTGLVASAAEANAIAFGDAANTAAGAFGAVALGAGARVTAPGALGSVALGQNSLASGATLADPAYLVGGAAAAEVNIGNRRLTGLAGGSADSDGVNVAQLRAATAGLTPVDAVTFDAGLGAYSALRGGAVSRITNVAPAALSPTSSDAVTGAQLFATNGAVTTNATTITNLGTTVTGLQANALLFDPALNAFDATRGGAPATITNVAPAALTATSTDAVNGGQLFATNAQVGTNTTAITNLTTNIANGTADPLAVRYTDAARGTLALGGATGTVVTNVAPGALAAGSTDAVNGAQLFATNSAVTTNATDITNLGTTVTALSANALLFNAGINAFDATRGGAPTTITNVAPATLSATSSDAVTGAQLFTTNGAVTTNATNITNLGTTVTGLQANALLFDPTLNAFNAARGGIPTAITNVAPAALTATSTDAVNGAQLFATNTQVGVNTSAIANLTTNIGNGTADPLAVRYTDATRANLALGGVAGTTVTNVAAGALTATSSEAVNGAQLFATNGAVTTNATNITNLGTTVTGLSGNALLFNAGLNAYDATRGGVPTTITNVAPAALGATSSDAVTGAQLFTTNGAVTTNTTNITNLSTTVSTLQGNALLFDANLNAFTAARGGAPTVITNVGAGALSATSSDAVNGAQLFATNQQVGANTTAITNLTSNIANGTADPLAVRYTDATKGTLALGGATGTVVTNVAAGNVTAISTDAVNGAQLNATNQAVAAVDTRVTNLGTSVASGLGGGSTVNADGSVTAPTYQVATVGTGGATTTSTYTNVGSAISGLGASISTVNSRVDAINTLTDRVVTYDGAAGSPRDTITLAGAAGTRLANVAAGAVSATSTEAVNGAQLNAVGQQVAVNTTNIATNTTNITRLQNGTAGFFQVNNTAGNAPPVASGANAIAAGGGAVSSGANAVALGTAATANGANSVALGSGSLADRDNSVSVGNATTARQITNVAAGTMPSDAVNLAQLTSGMNQTLGAANAYTDARLNQVGFDLRNLRRDANGGTAAAMALATIPQAYGPGMGIIGGGVSTWGGEQGFAIGVSKASPSSQVVFKAGAVINSRGKGGGAAGVGFGF